MKNHPPSPKRGAELVIDLIIKLGTNSRISFAACVKDNQKQHITVKAYLLPCLDCPINVTWQHWTAQPVRATSRPVKRCYFFGKRHSVLQGKFRHLIS